MAYGATLIKWICQVNHMKRIWVSLPDTLYDWVKEQAEIEGRSMSNFCARAVERDKEQKDEQKKNNK